MRQIITYTASTAMVLFFGYVPQYVLAQYPTQPAGTPGNVNPPGASPYLNLLRSGSSQAVNYYGLVRPQTDFRNSIQGLQQQVRTLGMEPPREAQGMELP